MDYSSYLQAIIDNQQAIIDSQQAIIDNQSQIIGLLGSELYVVIFVSVSILVLLFVQGFRNGNY